MEQSHPLEAIYFHDFRNSYIPNILKEIYLDKIYQPFLLGKKDLIIADWGGNIGLSSYYFKDFAKQVLCVEPSQQHLQCINKMIETNQIKNIKVCPYAISNNNGTTKFYHNQNSTMFSLKDTVNNQNDFEEVETVMPEEFMKREGIDHIDLLKWDTEGNEGEILASDSFKAVSDKIKVIAGEWHSWSSMSQSVFMNTFRDYGFEFNWLRGMEASVFTAVKI